MEEERVVMTFARTGKIMLDFIFNSLDYFKATLEESFARFYNSKHFTGEMKWDKLMRSGDKIAMQDLANTEVNLDKLKGELEKYGIGFAFYREPNSDVTHMAYAMRHEDVVKQAFSDVIRDITKSPEAFVDNVKKTQKDSNLDEKLKYYKQEDVVKRAEKTKDAPIKEPEMGGKTV